MSYSQNYFAKELNELNFGDIVDYFVAQQEESDKIEFKSYANPEERNHGEKENGVIRAISALLNSSGGLVIWGAPVGRAVQGQNEKIFQGALSPVTERIEKDRFMNRIGDLITPSPNCVRMKELEDNGSFVYVFEVEASTYSPHQYRNTYYMRIDGQSRPAPHPYIEALFRKITFPRIEGYVRILNYNSADPTAIVLTVQILIFNLSKLQNEHDIYFRLITTVGQFRNYAGPPVEEGGIFMNGSELRVHKAKPTLYYNEPLTRVERIYFRLGDLVNTEYSGTLLLYFAGKSSPLKLTEYRLNFNTNAFPNPNNLIEFQSENQFVHEQGDPELSEKQKIDEILGR